MLAKGPSNACFLTTQDGRCSSLQANPETGNPRTYLVSDLTCPVSGCTFTSRYVKRAIPPWLCWPLGHLLQPGDSQQVLSGPLFLLILIHTGRAVV